MFVLIADTHYGSNETIGSSGTVAKDIRAANNWIIRHDPDFLFHIGDVTHSGFISEFKAASHDWDMLIENTSLRNVWFTLGGAHDGYFGDYHANPSNRWSGAMFMRARNMTSLWYTIREGNNVFIFCNFIRGCRDWDSDYDDSGRPTNTIPENKLSWLEDQLRRYNRTENNIFVISHLQIVDTNAYSAPNDWAHMSDPSWQYSSEKLLDLFGRYRVDVYIHAHLHIDPDAAGGTGNCSVGNVLIRGVRSDLPNTTFLHATDICWQHGGRYSSKSTYPSLMYFNLTEGRKDFVLRAVNVATNSSVGITANDSATAHSYLRIPLSFEIKDMDSDNQVDDFEGSWTVWRFSDEGDYQWFDNRGLTCTSDEWILSRWDLWTPRTILGFQVNWSGTNGTIAHSFYRSDDGMQTWSGSFSDPRDLGRCRYIMVNTTIKPEAGRTIRIYDMNFDSAENNRPPGLAIEYDPTAARVTFDAIEGVGGTTLTTTKRGSLCAYRISDAAGNTTTVRLYSTTTVRPGSTIRKVQLDRCRFNGSTWMRLSERYSVRVWKVNGTVTKYRLNAIASTWSVSITYRAETGTSRMVINDGGWSAYTANGARTVVLSITVDGIDYSIV